MNHADVPEDHHRADPPHQVMDVGPADRDVPGPPADLLSDHPGARADEPEGPEQEDEEQEGGEPAGVDDLLLELAPDTGDRGQHAAHGTDGYGVRTTFPTFRRSAMNRCASAARSNGNDSATTGT